jgi:hypothetical protein
MAAFYSSAATRQAQSMCESVQVTGVTPREIVPWRRDVDGAELFALENTDEAQA